MIPKPPGSSGNRFVLAVRPVIRLPAKVTPCRHSHQVMVSTCGAYSFALALIIRRAISNLCQPPAPERLVAVENRTVRLRRISEKNAKKNLYKLITNYKLN